MTDSHRGCLYEDIILADESLNLIRQYFMDNPARCAFDRDNPLARPSIYSGSPDGVKTQSRKTLIANR